MLKVNFDDVEVDNCTGCYGIFFDELEIPRVCSPVGCLLSPLGLIRQ